MFGKLLADSGGGDQIVDTIIGRSSTRTLPWAMAAVGALIGLPMFFEIGLVLLMPVIFLVARRSGLSLIKVGIPALAGLSVMHGLVPPHPGPLVAIAALNANLGITLPSASSSPSRRSRSPARCSPATPPAGSTSLLRTCSTTSPTADLPPAATPIPTDRPVAPARPPRSSGAPSAARPSR